MPLRRVYSAFVIVLWGVLVFLLPITSLPILSKLANGATVAPLSAALALLLILVWFIPYILQKGSLPAETLPFLVFIFVALIASAGAYFIDIPSFKTNPFTREMVRSVPTLFIAVAFYFLASAWHKSPEQVRSTISIINLSGFFILAWSCLQAYYIYFHGSNYPDIMLRFQRTISTRDLIIGRMIGFAYEPSWLAHQLNTLYLPFWLGLTVARTSAYKFRIGIFTMENVLLAGGLAIVVLSSRVGLLSILLILGYLVIRLAIFLGKRLFSVMFNKFIIIPKKSIRILIQIVLGITLVGISVFVFGRGSLELVKLLGKLDPRLTPLFSGLTLTQLIQNPYGFFNQLVFAERYVYWVTGWRVFAGHPLLGVGLGNSGFFYPQYMPSYGWALPEVVGVYVRSPFLPNIKSFWVRLLAETGIVGFAAFLSWYFTLWRSSRLTESSTDSMTKAIGWAGQFVLIGFLAEGFSLDTFALPYLWISLGIVSATAAIFRKQLREQAAGPALDTKTQEDSKRYARI